MTITTLGTKTVKDSAGANIIVKTVNDTDDSSASPAHGIVDGLGFQFDPSPRIFVGNSFTRPADTLIYAAADLVANSTTAATVNAAIPTIQCARYAGQPTTLLRMRLRKSGTVLLNASFRVHLYNVQPTVSNGDNGVWLTNNVAGYVGAFDVTISRTMTDGSIGLGYSADSASIITTPVTGQNHLFYLIEARAAYTPISGEVFTPILEVA